MFSTGFRNQVMKYTGYLNGLRAERAATTRKKKILSTPTAKHTGQQSNQVQESELCKNDFKKLVSIKGQYVKIFCFFGNT